MKIVLATDGSSFSQSAADAAASAFRPAESEVLVVEVVDSSDYFVPPQMAPGYAPEKEEQLRERRSQAAASVEQAAQVLRAKGFKVTTRVADAEIRTGILDAAAEWHADLIVLGSHGKKGLRRFMLGSVAESVARHAPCSVLIVRASAQS